VTLRLDIRVSPRVPEVRRSWDDAAALARALKLRHEHVDLYAICVHANKRDLLRWLVRETLVMEVHWALLRQPDQLLRVLDGDNTAWPDLVATVPMAAATDLRPQGRVHDLAKLLDDARAHLEEPVEAAVTWGQYGRAPNRSLRLGSCEVGDPAVIRIHPVLDHETVPDWFVSFVLFHELLHVVFPPTRVGGRRVVHPAALRRAEAKHPDFGRATSWEHDNVGRLLARARRRA
jgi:hypothetical protein